MRQILRKTIAGGAALLLSSGMAAAADKVVVGAYESVSDAPLYIAKDKGYFEEEGLDVSFVKISSGGVMVSQLASENIDVSGGSPSVGVYNAVRQGLPMEIVADKGSTPPGHGYFAFVVRNDLVDQIKSAEDLRGKVLAVTGFRRGASSEVTIGKLLESADVDPADIKITDMGFSDILAGLGTGAVDVGVLVEPLVTLAEVRDVGKIWKRSDEIYPNQQYGALMYGPGIINRPDVAQRFMNAYIKGARFYNDALADGQPSPELVEILAANTSVKDPDLYQKMALPGINPNGKLNIEGMRHDSAWWHDAGLMSEPVPVEDVVNSSYAEKAVENLGPYEQNK